MTMTPPLTVAPGEDPDDVDLSEPPIGLPPTGDADGLSDDEAALVASFEARETERANAGTDSTDPASGEGAGEATPPEQATTNDQITEALGDEGTDEGGDEGSEGIKPVVEPTTATTGTGDQAGAAVQPPTAPDAVDVYGWQVSESEATQARQVYEWSQALQPQQVAQIDGILSGDLIPMTRAEIEALKSQSSQSPVTPAGTDGDLDEDIDPALAAKLGTFEQRLEQVAQTQAAQQSAQQAEYQQAIESQINEGITAFATQYALSPVEAEKLANKVVQMQILPGYARTNASPVEAMKAAMESVAWTDESFRKTQLELQAAAQVEAERQAATVTRERTRKQGSLMGNGGSVARVEPPATRDEKQKAMAKEISEAMSR